MKLPRIIKLNTSRLRSHGRFNKTTGLVFVISFAAIGSILLFTTRAAGPFASVEPELGTLSRSDLVFNDTTASGGRAVKFGAAATGQINCVPQPSRCGFADETNTGILPGVTLTKVPSQATSGSGWTCKPSPADCVTIVITGNVGTATTGLELADGVEAEITGSNITIKNLKLIGVHGQSSIGIKVAASTTGVTIDHCDLTGAPDSAGKVSPLRGWSGVLIVNGASNYAVNYCHMRGFSGPFFPHQEKGINTFIGNYAHNIVSIDNNLTDHCNVWGNGGGPDDLTSRQIIKDNTFYGDHPVCMSSTISLFADGNAQLNQHTIIEHNLISSGGYVCIEPGGGGVYSDQGRSYVAMRNNHFTTKDNPNCGYSAILRNAFPLDETSGEGNYQCGNVWDDGPLAGSGADQSNEYPSSMQPVTTCPNPAPW